jgi:hypothetical protein
LRTLVPFYLPVPSPILSNNIGCWCVQTVYCSDFSWR